MLLLLRARQLLSEIDKPEARELVQLIDNSAADEELLAAAKEVAEELGYDCEFDDWATTSKADFGTWVSAWVWVFRGEDEGEADGEGGTLGAAP